jgi:hypothetical protein
MDGSHDRGVDDTEWRRGVTHSRQALPSARGHGGAVPSTVSARICDVSTGILRRLLA